MTVKREILILLSVIAIAIAMVPKLRRAVNSDEDAQLSQSVSPTSIPLRSPSTTPSTTLSTTSTTPPTTTEAEKIACLPQTPCAWSIYKTDAKIVDTVITNTYCICVNSTACVITRDDSNVNAFIHHCQLPTETEESTES